MGGGVAAAAAPRRTKLVALGLAAAALLLIGYAVSRDDKPGAAASPNRAFGAPTESSYDRGGDRGESGSPSDPMSPADLFAQPPGEPSAPGEPTPMVVDQYGNPVDEETAKAILEQMERDAQDSMSRGRGHGKSKKKYKGR